MVALALILFFVTRKGKWSNEILEDLDKNKMPGFWNLNEQSEA